MKQIEKIEELERLVKRYEIPNGFTDREGVQGRVLYYLKTGEPIDEIISHLKEKAVKILESKLGVMLPQPPNEAVKRYEDQIRREIQELLS